jgi:hypothetical protein
MILLDPGKITARYRSLPSRTLPKFGTSSLDPYSLCIANAEDASESGWNLTQLTENQGGSSILPWATIQFIWFQ